MNEPVAGSNVLVLDTAGKSLGNEASALEQRANFVVVQDEVGYEIAGNLLRDIKGWQKKIKDYWEPLRVSAKQSYDNVLARKKEMLDPVENAEKILKRKMGSYTMEQERKAREQAEMQRRLAQEEAERKLAEALEMEKAGNSFGAEYAMAEAEVYDQVAATTSANVKQPKMQGVSTQKTWRIEILDESKIPVAVNGAVLRPVDKAAVLRMVKASKGQISIPGVKIIEDVAVSARA